MALPMTDMFRVPVYVPLSTRLAGASPGCTVIFRPPITAGMSNVKVKSSALFMVAERVQSYSL